MRESIIFYTVIVLGIVGVVLGIVALWAMPLLPFIGIPLIALGIGLSLLGLAVKKVVDTAKALLAPKK
jgi:uncharacterized membrane protein